MPASLGPTLRRPRPGRAPRRRTGRVRPPRSPLRRARRARALVGDRPLVAGASTSPRACTTTSARCGGSRSPRPAGPVGSSSCASPGRPAGGPSPRSSTEEAVMSLLTYDRRTAPTALRLLATARGRRCAKPSGRRPPPSVTRRRISPRCGQPRRSSPPGPGPTDVRRRPAPARGCCSPVSRPSSASGRPTSPPVPTSAPPHSPACAPRSPRARPTTCCATPTPSSSFVGDDAGAASRRPDRPLIAPTEPVDRPPHDRPLRPPPRRLRLLAATRRIASGRTGPARRRARHGHARATDRDGVYGAVKFVTACMQHGIRPVLGADLAVASPTAGREARRPPRVAARSSTTRLPQSHRAARTDGRGWAALCRLVSATHLAGERGSAGRPPSTSLPSTQRGLRRPARPRLRRRPGARRAAVPTSRQPPRPLARRPRDAGLERRVVVEIVDHRGPGDAVRAARMLAFAHDARVPAVLTNAVRGRRPQRRTDPRRPRRRAPARRARRAARRPGQRRGLSASPARRWRDVAAEVAHAAGLRRGRHVTCSPRTRRLADRCALDPRDDLGIGERALPRAHRCRRRRRRARRRVLRAALRGGPRPPRR